MMEAEARGMWPQAREHLEPQEAGGGGEGFSPPASRVCGTTGHLDSAIVDPRPGKEYNYAVLCHPSCDNLFWLPQETKDPIVHFHTYTSW